jgi:uncharacterized protein
VTVDSKDFPTSPEKPPEKILSSDISVDEEGDWYYHEDRIIREDILQLFLSNLCLSPDGSFFIAWRGQRCALQVADTPFVVSRVDRVRSKDEPHEKILISLKHLTDPEILDPSTLEVGAGNVPYCAIRNGQFRARFSRPAYYQLAAWIEQGPDTDSFYLEVNGRRHPITVAKHLLRDDAGQE